MLLLKLFLCSRNHNCGRCVNVSKNLFIHRLYFTDTNYKTRTIINNSIIQVQSRTYVSCVKESRVLSDISREWTLRFEENGVPEPESSMKYIIEFVLRRSGNQIHDNDINKSTRVTGDQEEQIRTLCECRLARMPVQYIIREWEFRELRLAMCPPVFIPRPETERLVDLVLAVLPTPATVLEVGCGSGAVCLSLLSARPQTQVFAVDQSSLACQLTKKNAELNNLTENLQVVKSKLEEDGSLSTALPLARESVDVLVSNPPYVPSAQLLDLQPEIKLYEDLRALEAGPDGLRVVRGLLRLAPAVLRQAGQVFLEVDSTHPRLIEQWLGLHPELGLSFVNTFTDYCDRQRFVQLQKL